MNIMFYSGSKSGLPGDLVGESLGLPPAAVQGVPLVSPQQLLLLLQFHVCQLVPCCHPLVNDATPGDLHDVLCNDQYDEQLGLRLLTCVRVQLTGLVETRELL